MLGEGWAQGRQFPVADSATGRRTGGLVGAPRPRARTGGVLVGAPRPPAAPEGVRAMWAHVAGGGQSDAVRSGEGLASGSGSAPPLLPATSHLLPPPGSGGQGLPVLAGCGASRRGFTASPQISKGETAQGRMLQEARWTAAPFLAAKRWG